MTRLSLSAFACASVLVLSGFAAQAGEGGGGGGDDRWAQPAVQSSHLNRGRDAARSTTRGGSTQSVAAGHGYRDVTVTRGGRSTSHRTGGSAEPTSAEWKDDKGNVVRWKPNRARQGDFAESRERRVTTRSDENPFGGRDVTTTRGGRSQTQPSIYDNKSWIR
jgi:hypothetical protein